jgi:hypothetical protein
MTQFAQADTRQPEPDLRRMSTLLDLRRRADRQEWRPDELKDMLLHQLRAPLYLSLGALSAEVVHQLRCNEPPLNARLTLGELFAHPQPPLELLKLVKRFAKQCRRDPDNPMPSDLVMLLYFVSITVALVRLDRRISDLADGHLRHGMSWLGEQVWVDAQVRSILSEGLELLRDSSEGDIPPGESEPTGKSMG